MRQVSGYPCPECGQDVLSDIVWLKHNDFAEAYEMELSCPECARVWTVRA